MADLPLRDPPVDEVRRVTESVLNDPRFADARPNWWDALWRRIGDLFDGAQLEFEGQSGSALGTIFLVLAVVALLIGLAFYARSIRRDPNRKVAVDAQIGRSSREWLEEADRHAAAGAWRDALRCHYRALLADLAEAGLVEEVPGRTTGEYLIAIAGDVPDATTPFTEVTRQFEVAWYGHGDVAAGDITRFERSAAAVRTVAGVRAPAKVRT